MIPKYCKKNDVVYFIPYTTDKPHITLGRITEDFYGKNFIAYNGVYCDDGEYFICLKEDFDKPRTKRIISNLLNSLNMGKVV